MKKILTPLALAVSLLGTAAQAQQTFKLAYIDPLSGPFASVGELMLNHVQFGVGEINAKGGVLKGTKLELLKFDSKLSAQESQTALQAAIDQGARVIVTGGSGSSVVGALVDAASKYNERNPDKAVIVLNHSSIDPDLTGKRCNFWHFQLEANTAMKMKALSNYIKKQADIKNVYLLNQDYAHGRQWASYGKEMVALARPDIKFVGEDLHAIGRVKDFAPYIAKIKASGADTVITGNWGSDLALLVKAANEGGYNGKFYTYYTGVTGTPTAVGKGGEGRVFQIAYSHYNLGGQAQKWGNEFQAKFDDDLYEHSVISIFKGLGQAMANAKSTDPVKVAPALEGLKYDSFAGEVEMRKADHQLQQPLYLTVWQKADKKYPYSPEHTGMTLAPVKAFESYVASTPTSCQMKRPS